MSRAASTGSAGLDVLSRRLLAAAPDLRVTVARPAERDAIFQLRAEHITAAGWGVLAERREADERRRPRAADRRVAQQNARRRDPARAPRPPLPVEEAFSLRIEPHGAVAEAGRLVVDPAQRGDPAHRAWASSSRPGHGSRCADAGPLPSRPARPPRRSTPARPRPAVRESSARPASTGASHAIRSASTRERGAPAGTRHSTARRSPQRSPRPDPPPPSQRSRSPLARWTRAPATVPDNSSSGGFLDPNIVAAEAKGDHGRQRVRRSMPLRRDFAQCASDDVLRQLVASVENGRVAALSGRRHEEVWRDFPIRRGLHLPSGCPGSQLGRRLRGAPWTSCPDVDRASCQGASILDHRGSVTLASRPSMSPPP